MFVYPQVDDEIKIDIKPDDLAHRHVPRVAAPAVSTSTGPIRRCASSHNPTGIVVQCQNERSQHKNRDSAMKQLRARLYEHEMEKKREETEDRRLQADINFGSQIRSYVLAPYRLVKDLRTKLAMGDVDRVLDGDLDALMHAWLVWRKTGKTAGDDKDESGE